MDFFFPLVLLNFLVYNAYKLFYVLSLNCNISLIYQYSKKTSLSISLLLANNSVECLIKIFFYNNYGKIDRDFFINEINAICLDQSIKI